MIVKILQGGQEEKINNSELNTSNFLPPDTIFKPELIRAIFNLINSERQLPVNVTERGNNQGFARLVSRPITVTTLNSFDREL